MTMKLPPPRSAPPPGADGRAPKWKTSGTWIAPVATAATLAEQHQRTAALEQLHGIYRSATGMQQGSAGCLLPASSEQTYLAWHAGRGPPPETCRLGCGPSRSSQTAWGRSLWCRCRSRTRSCRLHVACSVTQLRLHGMAAGRRIPGVHKPADLMLVTAPSCRLLSIHSVAPSGLLQRAV